MTDETQKSMLLVGLPDTGKTSFLAAFYHTATAEVPGKELFEYKLSKDATYLNQIHNKWLKCEVLERTTTLSKSEVTIHLQQTTSGQQFDLNIPDIAGESFSYQFSDRLWDLEYKARVDDSSGILLFINPNAIKAHTLIDDVNKALQGFIDEEEHVQEAVEFRLESCPTQVVLVDILTAHLDHINMVNTPIAIVISAWDMVRDQDITPDKWIESNLPLLYQYLITNFEGISFKVFGISAQGGELIEAEKIRALQALDEPAKRIIVQEGLQVHSNICMPIEWIINQWQKTII